MATTSTNSLTGKRVLVTRSRQQASDLVALLVQRGAIPIELPTIEIQDITDLGSVDRAIENIGTYDWVIFTSANGVRAFARRCLALGGIAAVLGSARVGAVGTSTASLLGEFGVDVAVCPSSFHAEAVVSEMRRFTIRGHRILLPQAQDARDILATGLSEQGAIVDRIAVYRTVDADNHETARRLFAARDVDIVLLTSSSTARNLVAALGNGADILTSAAVVVASIGPITSRAARDLGLAVAVEAEEHTIPGLVRALETFLGGQVDGN